VNKIEKDFYKRILNVFYSFLHLIHIHCNDDLEKLFFFSIFVYVKKPAGFFFRRITTYGRDSPPLRKAAVLKNSRIPLSPALVYTSACQGLAVGGCCEAAAYGIHPWTP
jgi:hypothetical protein